MNHLGYLVITAISLMLAFSVESASAFSISAKTTNMQAKNEKSKPILLARKSRKKKKKRGVRERNIIREKTYRGRKKNVDFDGVDIVGERKTAYGTSLGQKSAKKDFDLIHIRLRWHPEMVQSAASLETGRSR